jgi:small subunit ribosomal protein S18
MRSNDSSRNSGGGRFGQSQQGRMADPRNRVKRNDAPRRKRNPLKDIEYIDYSNTKLLMRFVNDQGKILPKRITGLTAKQQRSVTTAIKYARHLALLPFVAEDLR